MTDHVLKTLPEYWDAVKRGDKTFEVRRDDRGFQRGDTLILKRLRPDGTISEELSGSLCCFISYILTGGQFGIEAGYVVLGFKSIVEL